MQFDYLARAIALIGSVAVSSAVGLPANAGGLTAAPDGAATPSGDLPAVWQVASPEESDQVWEYILHSPLGIAALNQLAIEGFINPTCDRTLYTHAEFSTFQTLLRVDCFTPRAGAARAYSEIRVTFNRFEDIITDFEVERVDSEDESSLPDGVAEAVLAAAAAEAQVDPDALTILEAEPQTWPDGCLGLGGPAEACIAALTEGWRVVVSSGDRTWIFRTDGSGRQVRLDTEATP
ncbi:hypothetical protein C7271_20895 [filamentous cyanobacterium CCP5]|nr:hypothetical protein C7271_20895 [filamentous cyanobacterium CCP5]